MERHDDFVNAFGDIEEAVIYDEWCGRGVIKSKGDAITLLPERRFFVFGFATPPKGPSEADAEWGYTHGAQLIAATRGFARVDHVSILSPIHEICVDFDKEDEARTEISKITQTVETRCPIAEVFGIEGSGGGLVWVPKDPQIGPEWWFKAKSEAHKESQKVAPLWHDLKPSSSSLLSSQRHVSLRHASRRRSPAWRK